jgi:hypothetical protein
LRPYLEKEITKKGWWSGSSGKSTLNPEFKLQLPPTAPLKKRQLRNVLGWEQASKIDNILPLKRGLTLIGSNCGAIYAPLQYQNRIIS